MSTAHDESVSSFSFSLHLPSHRAHALYPPCFRPSSQGYRLFRNTLKRGIRLGAHQHVVQTDLNTISSARFIESGILNYIGFGFIGTGTSQWRPFPKVDRVSFLHSSRSPPRPPLCRRRVVSPHRFVVVAIPLCPLPSGVLRK